MNCRERVVWAAKQPPFCPGSFGAPAGLTVPRVTGRNGTPARGICAGCGREFQLGKYDGEVRGHRVKKGA